jgi:hypothetical protein
MNQKQTVLCLELLALAGSIVAAPMGTAFTYQGVATDNGRPATGLYDVQCVLYDAPTGGVQVGSTLNLPGSTTDSNGVFSVSLDFGPAVFNGQARWIEFGVRTNGSSGAYTTLSPRQELTPAPAAIWATTAGSLSGPLPSSQLSGTYSSVVTLNNAGNSFSGNGAGLSNVNAAMLGGLGAQNFWQLGGNAGTAPGANFLGTSDNQALEFKVKNIRGLRIEPNLSDEPNVIGGTYRNEVFNGVGVTIGGGDLNTVAGNLSTIGGGNLNTINSGANYAIIGGGSQNTISSSAAYATIAGGYYNDVGTNVTYGAIGGGFNNYILTDTQGGTIGGGYGNLVSGTYGTIPGGHYNNATNYCFAAGNRAKANHTGCFVWADSKNADFSTTGANRFLIRASGGVGINTASPGAALDVLGTTNTAIRGTTGQQGGAAVVGQASSTGDTRSFGGYFAAGGGGIGGVGVMGETTGNTGVGVYGYASSWQATDTYGGYFEAVGLECKGVYGRATSPGGVGVKGEADAGTGVVGIAANGYDFDAQGPGIHYHSGSSIRWKRDVRLIDEPLAKLTALRGVYFNWDAEHGGRHAVGMIAEEVGKVLPEIVGYESNGIDATGLDYSMLTPLLVEAGKALKTQVDELNQQMAEKDARIGALESELAGLKTMVKSLLEQAKGEGK